jgi:HEAT repeat protein
MLAVAMPLPVLQAQQRSPAPYLTMLDDPSMTIKQAAADTLGLLGASGVAALITRLQSDDQNVRYWAAVALGRVGPAAAEAAPALAHALFTSERSVRTRAAAALGQVGQAAVPVLVPALADTATQFWAALTLSRLGPHLRPVVPDLINALDAGSPIARAEVALALGEVGEPIPGAVPGLIRLLAVGDPWLTTRAAIVLGHMGPEARAAIPALEALAHDANPDVRARAAESLAAIREVKE